MKKLIAGLMLFLISQLAFGSARIQNEDVKGVTDITASVLTTTGNLTNGNACIASPGSLSNLISGLYIYDTTNPTYIGTPTTITGLPGSCSTGQIQMSQPALGNATGDTLTFGGQSSQLINDTKIWMTSVTPAQQLSTAVSKGVIAGSSGSKNYLTTYNGNTGNGNFEFGNTTGWSLGTVGTLTNGLPTGTPTFGSGSSGNLSLSATTTQAIAGTYSASYASSAATTAGNMMASSAFTIDKEDQAKVMTVKYYYSVISGASNDNFSGTSSNSFAWAAYDVTNSTWLSSAGNFCMTQNSGVGYCTGTFQTGATTASIRFVFYNTNATSGATTLVLDDFFVGPQTAPFGPTMTDLNLNLAFTVNGAGTITNNNIASARRSNMLLVQGSFTAGTSSGTTASIQLPAGLSIDYTAIGSTNVTVVNSNWLSASTNANANFYGNGNAGVGFVDGSTTNQIFLTYQNGTSGTSLVKEPGTSIFNSSKGFFVYFEVPIVGWSSNTSMSSDTDTRVVAAQVGMTTGTSFTGNSNILWDTIINDTHGGYNVSTGNYTVPVSGYYRATVGILAHTPITVVLTKNGSQIYRLAQIIPATIDTVYNGGITIKCNAGDTLSIQPNNSGTLFVSGTMYNYFTVERLSGPAVIAATESVNARYTSTASVNLFDNSTTIYNFDTKDYDSHNAVTTGATWKFVAPVSGKYSIKAATWISLSATGPREKYLYKNGSLHSILYSQPGSSVYGSSMAGSADVNLLAGDYIDIRDFQHSTSTLSYANSLGYNYISITRVGN